MTFFKPKQFVSSSPASSKASNKPFFAPSYFFNPETPFINPQGSPKWNDSTGKSESEVEHVKEEITPKTSGVTIQKKEANSSDDGSKKETELSEETVSEEPKSTEPTGRYWKHEWHIDRDGRESVFIWEVGGKRWHSNGDPGYTYLRNMAAKIPGDEGYDARFEKYEHRPQAHEGVKPELDFWFKKTPGWDNPNQLDDGSADFEDLAEFKGPSYNKKRTGFYKMAFVFDPKIYEKLDAERLQKQNRSYIGITTNYKGYVNAENGIILHFTPIPQDATYKKRSASKNPKYIIATNAPVVVLAEGNEQNEGWVYVRSQSGDEGWIERGFISLKPEIKTNDSFDSYTVVAGDGLEGLIKRYYGKYPIETGNDRRTVALAIYLYNKGLPGSGVYRNYAKYKHSKKLNTLKDSLDFWMTETRANYHSVELYIGGKVFLPPVKYILEMRRKGELEKRSDFANTMIETGEVILGFSNGVNSGFVNAIVETGEDLYNMIKDIFTGEIFNQIKELFTLLVEKGFSGVWEMIKDLAVGTWEDLKAAWNNPNAYDRGEYFGEIVGAILFEVVLALITYGAVFAIKQSTRVAKILKWLPNLKSVKKIIPSKNDRYSVDLDKMNLDVEKRKVSKNNDFDGNSKVVESNGVVEKLESLKSWAKTNGLDYLTNEEIKGTFDLFEGNINLTQKSLLSTKEIVTGMNLDDLASHLELPITPSSKSLTPYQSRVWYSWRKSKIYLLVDRSKGLKAAAREAVEMRNSIRLMARESMSDSDISDYLNTKEINKTFNEIFEEKSKLYPNSDDVYTAIIESSMKGRGLVDILYKIPK